MKLLVIGIDALDYKSVIERKELFNSFNIVRMPADVPLTGSAWTSLYTGQPQVVHGIKTVHGVFHTAESKSFETCSCKFLWDYLPDVCMSIFGMPVTFPPVKVNGYMVSGDIVPSKESDYTNPIDIKAGLQEYYIDIWHYLEKIGFDHIAKRPRLIKEFIAERRQDTDSGLGKAYDTINSGILNNYLKLHDMKHEFGMIGFSFIDRVFHWTATDKNRIDFWYYKVVEIVEKLMQVVQPENIIMVSDHGMPTKKENPKHEKDGVFMYFGKDFKKNDFRDCTQYDFLPTVLDFFGKKADGLGGKILNIKV